MAANRGPQKARSSRNGRLAVSIEGSTRRRWPGRIKAWRPPASPRAKRRGPPLACRPTNPIPASSGHQQAAGRLPQLSTQPGQLARRSDSPSRRPPHPVMHMAAEAVAATPLAAGPAPAAARRLQPQRARALPHARPTRCRANPPSGAGTASSSSGASTSSSTPMDVLRNDISLLAGAHDEVRRWLPHRRRLRWLPAAPGRNCCRARVLFPKCLLTTERCRRRWWRCSTRLRARR